MNCNNCNSSKVLKGKKLMLGVEVGNVGIPYKKGIFRGVEPLLVDLCEDCGEVIRIYVDNLQRKWQ